MKLNRMYSFLKTDIDEIEKELEVAIESDSRLFRRLPFIFFKQAERESGLFLFCLSAKFGQYEINTMKNVAVALRADPYGFSGP